MSSVRSVRKCQKPFLTLKSLSGSDFLEKCQSVRREHVQFNMKHVRETDQPPLNQQIT